MLAALEFGDPSVVIEGAIEEAAGDAVVGGEIPTVNDSDEEDLVDSMRDLGIAHFAEVSALRYTPPVLPF